jgi:hypothetical protein
MKKLLIPVLMTILLVGSVNAAVTYCINTDTGNICLNNNWLNGTKINYSDILNPPASGSADITAVTTDGPYLSGGVTSGDADLLLNETFLNATIDARSGGGGGSFDLNASNETDGSPQFSIEEGDIFKIIGITGINVILDTVREQYNLSVTVVDTNETARVNDLNSSKAGIGDCPSGNFIQNATATGVECDAPSGSGDITAVNTNGPYLSGGAGSGDVSILLNETELNATIDARDTNTWNTTEQMQDAAGAMDGGTETLIAVTYDDASNQMNYVVTSTLSSYTDDLTHTTDTNDTFRVNDLNASKAGTGTCTTPQFVQNTTSTGVQCAIPVDTDTDTTIGNCTLSDSCKPIVYQDRNENITANNWNFTSTTGRIRTGGGFHLFWNTTCGGMNISGTVIEVCR